MSSKQYPEGMRQKSGAKGKGKRKKKKLSCNSREKRRHESIYRNGDIVGRSSSHHSRKERAGRWPWVWRRPCAMRGRSRQLPRPFPWEIPFLEFKMIRDIPSSAVIAGKYGSISVGGGWIRPAGSILPGLARAWKQDSFVAQPACAAGLPEVVTVPGAGLPCGPWADSAPAWALAAGKAGQCSRWDLQPRARPAPSHCCHNALL